MILFFNLNYINRKFQNLFMKIPKTYSLTKDDGTLKENIIINKNIIEVIDYLDIKEGLKISYTFDRLGNYVESEIIVTTYPDFDKHVIKIPVYKVGLKVRDIKNLKEKNFCFCKNYVDLNKLSKRISEFRNEKR